MISACACVCVCVNAGVCKSEGLQACSYIYNEDVCVYEWVDFYVFSLCIRVHIHSGPACALTSSCAHTHTHKSSRSL